MKVKNTVLLVINLFTLRLLLWSANHVAGHYYVQCTQTGGSRFRYFGSHWFLYDDNQLMGIGTEKFRSKYAAVMSAQFYPDTLSTPFIGNDGVEKQDCPYSWNKLAVRDVQLCDEKDERVKMRFYAVKQTGSNGKMHTLNGWLHIEIELVDESDEIRFLYVQVVDNYYNSIGEFVTNPSEQCPPTNPSLFISPTPYQVLPCDAVGSREVKPSQAVWMVAKQDLFHPSTGTSTDPQFMPIQKLGRGVHLTWRLDEYWCNRHFKFRPEVYIATSKNINLWEINTKNGTVTSTNSFKDHRVYRKNPNYWLRSEWVGAADIKHPIRGELKCDKLVTNAVGVTGGLTSEAPWIRETVKSTVKQEYFHPDFGIEVCQVDLTNGLPETHAVFGGRCEKPFQSQRSSHEFVQSCNTSSEEFRGLNVNFTKYKTYVNESQHIRFKHCSQPCRAPETEKDAIDISNIIINKTSTDLNPVGGLSHKTRTKHSILRFWRARKYHGLLSIFCGMFLNPVSAVAARYLKETFMEKQYFSIHLWYWFHVCCSVAAGTISTTSQVTLYSSIGSWGRSLHWAGIIHHSFGCLANIVFVILSTVGAFRNGSIKWRKLMLRIHLIVGYGHYTTCLFLIAISAKIPESPLLHHCDVDGFPIGTPLIYYVVGGWILVDVCFHLLMTRTEHIVERRIMVVHPGYFRTIPVLSPQSHQDMRCSYCRRYIFYAYIGMSFLFTWTAMLHLTIRSQPQKCSFGKTSCKAALGCTTAAFAMCKNLNYKNCER